MYDITYMPIIKVVIITKNKEQFPVLGHRIDTDVDLNHAMNYCRSFRIDPKWMLRSGQIVPFSVDRVIVRTYFSSTRIPISETT